MLKLALVFVAVFVVSEAGAFVPLKPVPCTHAPGRPKLPCVCGHCIYDFVLYAPLCDCKPGWTGKFCSKGPCDTAPNQCGVKGVCVQDDCAEEKKCVCKHGYTGKHCEISPCEAKGATYCGNCGTCENRETAPFAECNCAPGWTGPQCRKGPCQTEPTQPPCGQNGECKQDGCAAVKTCDCKHGYTGKHCENDPCFPEPCVCGECVVTKLPPYFYTCDCDPYFGERLCDRACASAPEDCIANTCQQKGTSCKVCCKVKECFPKPH